MITLLLDAKRATLEEIEEIEVERDLVQPDTAAGIDPSLTKEIKAEADMMSKASDPPTKE